MIHGQEGRGRYKAFALGTSVEWKVCYLGNQRKPKVFDVRLKGADLKDVEIGDETDAPGRGPGAIVVITDVKKDWHH